MRFALLLPVLLLSLSGFAQKYYLFIGTYTNTKVESKGIYVYQFDAATGQTTPVSSAFTDNPSYLAIAPGGNFLYAVNETDGAKPGRVSSFSFSKSNGQLTFLNEQPTGGDDPCYVSVDDQRKWLMIANYSGGNLSALPIRADGSISPLAQLIQHTGKGFNPQRQEKPHVHSVTFTPDKHFVIAADLGLDKLSIYRFTTNATTPLSAPTDSTVATQPGSGPRHISFTPDGRYVYQINEMGGTVNAFGYKAGKLTLIQQTLTHPESFTEDIGSADIHVSPNGKFLYASNRGVANNIAIYSIDPASGKLTTQGYQSTLGQGPRNFIIDPSGQWLLVANQRTNNIVIFHIDPQTGLLKASDAQLNIPAPVCLKLLPL